MIVPLFVSVGAKPAIVATVLFERMVPVLVDAPGYMETA